MGGEFISKVFQHDCDENGIKREFSTEEHHNKMELLKVKIELYRKWT